MFVDISQSCKYYYVGCLSMVCIVRWKYQFLSRAGLAWLFWKCDLREISGQTDPHWLSDYAEVATGDQEAGINFTVFVYFLSNWQQVCPAQASSPEISLLPLNSWCWSPCSTCSTRPPGSDSGAPWRRWGGPRSDRRNTLSWAARRMASDSSKWSRLSPPPPSHLNRRERLEAGYLVVGVQSLPVMVSPSEMSWMGWWWWWWWWWLVSW